MEQAWIVHKFGGTSVADADRYRHAARLFLEEPGERKAVVVSAMSGVTSTLVELVNLAQKRDESVYEKLKALEDRHVRIVDSLLEPTAASKLRAAMRIDFDEIRELLRGIWLAKTAAERTQELVSGYGEIWSAQILNGVLKAMGRSSLWLDAREVLIVEPGAFSVTVDWDESQRRLDKWLESHPTELLVITGFVASTAEGIATTLKRNGSDFSASIMGYLLHASSITIWTDVDGVMSADPRYVPDAVVLSQLSYREATELAYFGAKVIHPATMEPAIRGRIPIYIRNSLAPSQPGTEISETTSPDHVVKGFSAMDQLCLINLEGTGIMGIPGIAQKLFAALKEAGISVILISQASSEQSICFAVPMVQSELARKKVEEAFFLEIRQGRIQRVSLVPDCGVIAAVGDRMIERPGVAGAFFTALGDAGVNVRAIAQGSSERNISVVIDRHDTEKALRAVHSAFYLSNQTLSVGVIGAGLIGSALLSQVKQEIERLRKERRIDIRVRGIMNSTRMILGESQLDLDDWKAALEKSAEKPDLARFVDRIQTPSVPHAVLIDVTASPEIPRHYPEWLKRGIHVVTPNKKANTAPMSFYRELASSARAGSGSDSRYYLYDTTVGAGLPVLHTLRDLIQTGDRIHRIEGILSGTLAYIFNSYAGEKPFAEVVREAREKGYTEPDPRDDLSGRDVARKLVILAREMGLPMELEQVQVESLVPDELQGKEIGVAQFLELLPKHDGKVKSALAAAKDQDQVLRYVGSVDAEGKATVSLRSYPRSHPFARITGSDNIVAFETERYRQQNLIIQGPGAGPEVTAAGVFANLLRIACYLGAPL